MHAVDSLGHEAFGTGAETVFVLNDWLCDTSTWDTARAYLDTDAFRWVFTDLRGYGRSRGRAGRFTLEEAAADVRALADEMGLSRFAIVGHSMSSLVALHLAQTCPDRVTRAVVLTPPPPTSFQVDGATLASMQAFGGGTDERRAPGVRMMVGALSEGWVRFKVRRWGETADREAVAGYTAMFATVGLPDVATPVRCPVLAVTGERDGETMRAAAVERALAPLCGSLTVVPLADCGHYPMQEAPPLLVATVERFLRPG